MGKTAFTCGAAIFVGSHALLYLGVYYSPLFDVVWNNYYDQTTSWTFLRDGDGNTSSLLEAQQAQVSNGTRISFLREEHVSKPAQALAHRGGRQQVMAPVVGLGKQQAAAMVDLDRAVKTKSIMDSLHHHGILLPVALYLFVIVLPMLKLALVAVSCGGKLCACNCQLISVLSSRWAAVCAVAAAGVVVCVKGCVKYAQLQAGFTAVKDAQLQVGYTAVIGYVFLCGFGTWLMLPDGPREDLFLGDVLPGHRRSAKIALPVATLLSAVSLYFGIVGHPIVDDLKVRDMIELVVESGPIHAKVGSIALFVGVFVVPVLEALLGLVLVIFAPCITGHSFFQSLSDFAAEFSLLDVFVVGMYMRTCVMSVLGKAVERQVINFKGLQPGFACLVVAAVLGWLSRYFAALVMAPSKDEA